MSSEHKEHYDAVVIGGGAAGAQCALWLDMMGYRPCILEMHDRLGGVGNENDFTYHGIALAEHPLTGREIGNLINNSVARSKVSCFLKSGVVDLNKLDDGFLIRFSSNNLEHEVQTRYVVIATGVVPKTGGISPDARVLIGPNDRIATFDFASKRVAILGGGDNAFENYCSISKMAPSAVHIYARTIRGRSEFVRRASVNDVFVGTVDFDSYEMTVNGHHYDVVVVLYGWKPDLPFLRRLQADRDSHGFLVIDHKTAETSIKNVFAIGDVANRESPAVITAMAGGLVAAKEIQRRIDSETGNTGSRVLNFAGMLTE